jgi:small-conductance mechanosensitive channel
MFIKVAATSTPLTQVALDTRSHIQKIYDWFIGAPLHILAIAGLAFLASVFGAHMLTRWTSRLSQVHPHRRNSTTQVERQRERAATVSSILKSTMNATIGIIAISMILSELGLNLGPVIASAGVLGVALGLGAQTLVRDILAGIFMLVEDQYGVGDEVTTLDVSGVVESVGLRITSVRAHDGTLWYLRNGEILKLGNKSQPK